MKIAAVLEVVHDASELELVLVDPEDCGDAVVRPGRRRIGVPPFEVPPGSEIEWTPSRAGTTLNVQPAAPTSCAIPPGRPAAAADAEVAADRDEAQCDADSCCADRPRTAAPRALVGCWARCFGAFTRGLSAMPRANVAAPLFSPGCDKRCRPPTRLPSVGSMIIASLLIGLAIGAVAVLVAVRPALVERRRRVQEVIELERALAGAEAELAVERGSLDERLEARSSHSPRRRSTRTALVSSSSPRRICPVTSGR